MKAGRESLRWTWNEVPGTLVQGPGVQNYMCIRIEFGRPSKLGAHLLSRSIWGSQVECFLTGRINLLGCDVERLPLRASMELARGVCRLIS